MCIIEWISHSRETTIALLWPRFRFGLPVSHGGVRSVECNVRFSCAYEVENTNCVALSRETILIYYIVCDRGVGGGLECVCLYVLLHYAIVFHVRRPSLLLSNRTSCANVFTAHKHTVVAANYL